LYDELKLRAAAMLRQEDRGHTLQATALVHEAYMKLAQQTRAEIQNESHALALAAVAMRRVLIDHARTKGRDKRGGDKKAVPLDSGITLAGVASQADPIDLLVLEDILSRLEKSQPRYAKIIELRFFGGLTNAQVADVLDVSLGTVESDWKLARELLSEELKK
jgi:RNA polymerase sigma factor (TIGR02999 family)